MVSQGPTELPFSWEGKHPETIRNDCRWLESITRNAAPFTDWWTKARIVQLAYPTPPANIVKPAQSKLYAGLSSETEIVQALRSLSSPEDYPRFHREVTESYVANVLNCWHSRQFSLAVSRNFEVYVDRQFANTFLVTSTAPVSLEVDRTLPPASRYRPLFNVDELAEIMNRADAQQMTVRTHGYSTPAKNFFQLFSQETIGLNTPDSTTQVRTLQDNHFYVGYQWPSEAPFVSPGLWVDYRTHPGIVVKFLVTLAGVAGIAGTVLYALGRLLNLDRWILGLLSSQGSIAPGTPLSWLGTVLIVFGLWVLLFLVLRVVVYQRDRNRAIHYGAPDLAEFLWRLDAALSKRKNQVPSPGEETQERTLTINLIGHSMGALVVVNMLRVLSDRFGKDDWLDQEDRPLLPDSLAPVVETADNIGNHFRLDHLILTSPDIPLELLREGRNNYVRSAMRRCRRIYLFSSDRDTVLRYLSALINWFGEPSIQMAGMRLGNVYLKRLRRSGELRPYLRILVHSEAAIQPTSSYELFQKFNYLDCSEMRGDRGVGGVNGILLPLNVLTALPIDLGNMLLSTLKINRLDVHGGYFQTQTASFHVLKFLLTANFLADEVVKQEVDQLIANTPIRFLPSQPWMMPPTEE